MVHTREASRKVWCESDNFPLENVSDCTWQVFQVCGNPRNSCSKYETKGENLSLRILSLASINVSKLVETFPNSLLAKKTLRMKPQKQKLCRMTILIKSTSCYDRVTVTLLLQCFFFRLWYNFTGLDFPDVIWLLSWWLFVWAGRARRKEGGKTERGCHECAELRIKITTYRNWDVQKICDEMITNQSWGGVIINLYEKSCEDIASMSSWTSVRKFLAVFLQNDMLWNKDILQPTPECQGQNLKHHREPFYLPGPKGRWSLKETCSSAAFQRTTPSDATWQAGTDRRQFDVRLTHLCEQVEQARGCKKKKKKPVNGARAESRRDTTHSCKQRDAWNVKELPLTGKQRQEETHSQSAQLPNTSSQLLLYSAFAADGKNVTNRSCNTGVEVFILLPVSL